MASSSVLCRRTGVQIRSLQFLTKKVYYLDAMPPQVVDQFENHHRCQICCSFGELFQARFGGQKLLPHVKHTTTLPLDEGNRFSVPMFSVPDPGFQIVEPPSFPRISTDWGISDNLPKHVRYPPFLLRFVH